MRDQIISAAKTNNMMGDYAKSN